MQLVTERDSGPLSSHASDRFNLMYNILSYCTIDGKPVCITPVTNRLRDVDTTEK